MEYPWTVVGWEMVPRKNDPDKHNIRLHCQQQLPADCAGDGLACKTVYFNPEYVKYDPVLGHKIITTEGRYGIDRIIVVS